MTFGLEQKLCSDKNWVTATLLVIGLVFILEITLPVGTGSRPFYAAIGLNKNTVFPLLSSILFVLSTLFRF